MLNTVPGNGVFGAMQFVDGLSDRHSLETHSPTLEAKPIEAIAT